MRKIIFVATAGAILIFAIYITYNLLSRKLPPSIPVASPSPISSTMQLTSPAFSPNSSIPAKYTCDGQNLNPPLSFSDVPDQTKSLSLVVEDPDAPAGIWAHWLLWNISPSISQISEGRSPADSITGTNDFGQTSYGGPCPPSGTHRYLFNLYALDTTLDLPPTTTRTKLESALTGHVLGKSQLIGNYSRK